MKNKIFNVISVLFALLMINGGLNKFFNYLPVPPDLPVDLVNDNAALLEIEWMMPLVASAELLGGILILFSKTRALGAIIVFPIVVGILLLHATVAPNELPIALVLVAVLGWMFYENREKYLQLIK